MLKYLGVKGHSLYNLLLKDIARISRILISIKCVCMYVYEIEKANVSRF